jgi:hypothetical protein
LEVVEVDVIAPVELTEVKFPVPAVSVPDALTVPIVSACEVAVMGPVDKMEVKYPVRPVIPPDELRPVVLTGREKKADVPV